MIDGQSDVELKGRFDGVIPSAAVLQAERGTSGITEPVGTREIPRAAGKNAALRNDALSRGRPKISQQGSCGQRMEL